MIEREGGEGDVDKECDRVIERERVKKELLIRQCRDSQTQAEPNSGCSAKNTVCVCVCVSECVCV